MNKDNFEKKFEEIMKTHYDFSRSRYQSWEAQQYLNWFVECYAYRRPKDKFKYIIPAPVSIDQQLGVILGVVNDNESEWSSIRYTISEFGFYCLERLKLINDINTKL